MDPAVEDVVDDSNDDEYEDDFFENEENERRSSIVSTRAEPLSRDVSHDKANSSGEVSISEVVNSRSKSGNLIAINNVKSEIASENDTTEVASHAPLHLRQKQPDVDKGLLSSSDDTKTLVEQGEKYLKLAQEVNAKRDELVQIKQELEQFRSLLLKGIVDDTDKVEDYSHVPLGELLRIRLQAVDNSEQESISCARSKNVEEADNDKASQREKGILEEKLVKMRRQITLLQTKCNDMKSRVDEFDKCELEVNRLNKKIVHMVERSRYERDMRGKAESRVRITEKKVEVLSDHIERLMAYLKSEATAKVRLVKSRMRFLREIELLRKRDDVLTKKIKSKDRFIEDMKGGVKVLEDQLRLMDEKYMELRLKLDWSRTYTEKVVNKRDEEIQQLQDQLTIARYARVEASTVRKKSFCR